MMSIKEEMMIMGVMKPKGKMMRKAGKLGEL